MLNNFTIDSFPTTIIKGGNINSEITRMTPENIQASADYAKDNKLPFVNLTQCTKDLKKFYNLPENITLIYKKTDFPANYNKQTAFSNKTNFGVI